MDNDRHETSLPTIKELAIHAAIVVLLILVGLGLSSMAYWHAEGIASSWTDSLQPKLQLALDPTTKHFCNPAGVRHGNFEDRLEDQFREIRGRMRHHLEVMVYFYANYFRAIVMASILGAVSGVGLFYIANKGWTNANNYVITTFVVSTVMAAYFLSFITVFKVQDNISDNKTLYLQYVILSNQVATYCSTYTSEDEPSLAEDPYIHQLDKKMATLNDIAIGFDYTKIADYKSILSSSSQTPTQTATNKPPSSSVKNASGGKNQKPPVPKPGPSK